MAYNILLKRRWQWQQWQTESSEKTPQCRIKQSTRDSRRVVWTLAWQTRTHAGTHTCFQSKKEVRRNFNLKKKQPQHLEALSPFDPIPCLILPLCLLHLNTGLLDPCLDGVKCTHQHTCVGADVCRHVGECACEWHKHIQKVVFTTVLFWLKYIILKDWMSCWFNYMWSNLHVKVCVVGQTLYSRPQSKDTRWF